MNNNLSAPSIEDCFQKMPVVAILRGVEPDDVVDIAETIFSAGIRIIEVPLNSPQPIESIARLSSEMGDRCVIGAGTVKTVAETQQVADAGGRIAVSPNTVNAVIRESRELGLTPMPGWASATEALAAYTAGARYLKLFPAASYGAEHVRAVRAILPRDAKIVAVGGVGSDSLEPWFDAGIAGIGIGSELYRSGDTVLSVGQKAADIVGAVTAVHSHRETDR